MDIHSMILYEDKDIIVCRKAAGLPVQHKNHGVLDMESMLKNYLAMRSASSGEIPYLGVIHRLDQPVEGVIVFALNKKAAAALSAQMRDGFMNKEYLALVKPDKEDPALYDETSGWHQLTDYMIRDGRTNTSRIVRKETPGSREARLSWREVKEGAGSYPSDEVLLRIMLDTGRHHQIRVQLAHAGMPIVGDRKYGHSDMAEGGPLCLSACTLSFEHPSRGKEMCFEISPAFLNRV